MKLLSPLLFALLLLTSCGVTNFPANKPFVFDNKVILKGNFSKDEKKRLTNELNNYWDDSLRVVKSQTLGITTRKNPPVFNKESVSLTKKFMNSYLRSQGYYYADFEKDSVQIKNCNYIKLFPNNGLKDEGFFKRIFHFKVITKRKQIRATPIIIINAGKSTLIDSVSFALTDTALQALTLKHEKESLLKKGDNYTKQKISNELDRLATLYKNNGYYSFKQEYLYALVDTSNEKFLKLVVDPFEQAKLLAELDKEKKQDPKWDIAIMLRKNIEPSITHKYYIGRSYFYTDLPIDSIFSTETILARNYLHTDSVKNSIFKYNKQIIKPAPLLVHNYLKSGRQYRETAYIKTLNSISQLGVWKQVDSKVFLRDKDSLDIYYFLTPEKKYNFASNLEGSNNTGDIASGNLLGISAYVSRLNRNFLKSAIQSTTSIRTGIELSGTDTLKAIQSFQINFTKSFSIPKHLLIGDKTISFLQNPTFLSPIVKPIARFLFSVTNLDKADNKRTLVNLNASYTDRFEVFRLRSLIGNFGWGWSYRNTSWLYKPLNLELYSLDQLPGLDELIKNNPPLKYSFNNGNVVGQMLSIQHTKNSTKHPGYSYLIRGGFEESGLIATVFRSLQHNVYQYIKLEGEYKGTFKYKKSELAWRGFMGVGFNFSTTNNFGNVLPFFKQFAAGGPNSMRAWGVRQLGQGSSIRTDTSNTSFKDRFGDMQIEANLEYRFQLFDLGFLKIGSALYADIGNIWNVRKDTSNPKAEFDISRFGKDLAIAVGTGLRFNFSSYFLLRVDLAYKLKDPARLYNNGWADIRHISNTEYRINGTEVNNLKLQIGIGMPF